MSEQVTFFRNTR